MRKLTYHNNLIYDLTEVDLVYFDFEGDQHTQPLSEAIEEGTLTDPHTLDSMKIDGYYYRDEYFEMHPEVEFTNHAEDARILYRDRNNDIHSQSLEHMEEHDSLFNTTHDTLMYVVGFIQ